LRGRGKGKGRVYKKTHPFSLDDSWLIVDSVKRGAEAEVVHKMVEVLFHVVRGVQKGKIREGGNNKHEE
jgi:hypothetical protein